MTAFSSNLFGSKQTDMPDALKENRANGEPHGLGSGDSCESLRSFKDDHMMTNDINLDNNDQFDIVSQNTESTEPQAELSSVSSDDDWTPFPVERLPEPIRSLVTEGAAAIGCDPVYIALACLVVAAAAIGNTRRIAIKRTWLPCHVLWAAIVGESGSMKTPAFSLVTEPVLRLQRDLMRSFEQDQIAHHANVERYKEELTAWRSDDSGEESPKRPEPPVLKRCIVKDVTVEKLAQILKDNWRGVLVACDELNAWFGSFNRYSGKTGGADEAFWLSCFNCQTAIVDRKTGVPPTLYVPDAAVCVLGGIQPEILGRAMSSQNRESGMAARLLMVCPPRKAKRWTDVDVPQKTLNAWADLIGRLLELQPELDSHEDPKASLVRIDTAAKQRFVKFYNQHNSEQIDLTGDLAAAWSKLEEYALRFALILHLIQGDEEDPMDPSSNKVQASTMEDAIAITEWFKAEARRVYRMLDKSAISQRDKDLMATIRDLGGRCSVRDLMSKHRGEYPNSEAAEAALHNLVRLHVGTWETRIPEGNVGRPSTVFVLRHGL